MWRQLICCQCLTNEATSQVQENIPSCHNSHQQSQPYCVMDTTTLPKPRDSPSTLKPYWHRLGQFGQFRFLSLNRKKQRKVKLWEVYACNPLNIVLIPEPRWRKLFTKLYSQQYRCSVLALWDGEGEMPGLGIQVTLGEALEVRGCPLQEAEIWSVMCQAAEALQDVFLNGEAVEDGVPVFAVTASTLLLGPTGRVEFAESSFKTISETDCVPPEYITTQTYTEESIEKMYVFALGMTMYSSADYRLPETQELQIGPTLDSLLGGMCEENATHRVGLIQVLEACSHFTRTHPNKPPSSHYAVKLYKSVLGSDQQLDGVRPHDDSTDYEYISPRSRGRHSRKRINKTTTSRSRSRSRSRTRDSYARMAHHERPLPVGRDHPVDFNDGRLSKGQSFSSHHSGHRYSRDAVQWDGAHMHHTHRATAAYGSHPSSAKSQHSRRSLADDQSYGWPTPERSIARSHAHSITNDPPRVATFKSQKNPQSREALQLTYNRLKDRQRKLNTLRFGMDIDDMEYSEVGSVLSEATDFGDRRSLISSTSYTQGMYQPGLLSPYGSQVALRLGRESDPISLGLEEDGLGSEANWIKRQQDEILARQKGDARSLEPRMLGDGARSDPYRDILSADGRSSTHHKNSKSKVKLKPSNRPTRKAFGPEFVNNDVVTNLTLPQARLSGGTNLRRVRVVLLSGQHLDVGCEPNNTNKMLFDAVISHLGVSEQFLFGLSFIHEGEHFFTDPEAKLYKIAPPQWKDPPKGQLPSPFTLYFRVKFYPENILGVQNQTIRHLFYLQLRRDLLEERCFTTEEQAMILAGFAIQAEYGDWHEHHAEITPEHYFPQRTLRRIGRAYAKDNIPERHKVHQGLTDEEAEYGYVKEMQHLSESGLHFHKMYRSKKDSGNPLVVGIGVLGLSLWERQGDQRSIINHHAWQDVQKISFNRRRFSVLPKSDAGQMKVSKMNFYMDSYKKGRYLVQLCTAYHKFQLMMKLRVESNLDYPEEGLSSDCEMGYEEDGDDNEDYIVDAAVASSPHTDQTRNTRNRGIVKPADSSDDFSDELQAVQSRMETQVKESLPAYSMPPRKSKGLLENKLDMLPSSESTERRVIVVDLKKDSKVGIGLTIVGGENTGRLDLGVFVRTISPSGPAAKDGRIKSGDRIIAIDGHSLEGLAHHLAVEMIRDAPGSSVQLMLSQAINPIVDPTHSSQDIHPDNKPSSSHHILSHGQVAIPTLTQLPSDADSSDLELEDVVPAEVLKDHHRRKIIVAEDKPDDGNGYISDIELDEAVTNVTNHMSSTGGSSPYSKPAISQSANQYEVTLTKTNNSLGLNVTGGINTSVRHGGIYVKSLQPEGPAEKCGVIHIFDRLLFINDNDLRNVTHKQAAEGLRNAPQVCHLIMERSLSPSTMPRDQHADITGLTHDRSSNARLSQTASPLYIEETIRDMEVEFPFVNKDNVHVCKLHRDVSGLGFSVLTDTQLGLVSIRQVFPTGPAALSGLLRSGDIILSVNNNRLDNLPHSDVMTILRTTDSDVRLLVFRPQLSSEIFDGLSNQDDDNAANDSSSIFVPIITHAEINHANVTATDTHNDTTTDVGEVESFAGLPDSDNESVLTDVFDKLVESNEVHSTSKRKSKKHTPHTNTDEPRLPTPVQSFDQDAGIDSDSADYPEDLNSTQEDSRIYEVTLTKGEKGMGFTVAGGPTVAGQFFVKDVLYPPASTDGQIARGDRLLMVNGENLSSMNHKQAISYLRQTPTTVTLKFLRSSSNILDATRKSPCRKEEEDSSGESDGSNDGALHAVKTASPSAKSVKDMVKKMEGSKQPMIRAHAYKDGLPGKKDIDEISDGELLDTLTESEINANLNLPGHNTSLLSTGSSFGEITLPMPDELESDVDDKAELDEDFSHTQKGVIRVELVKSDQGSLGFSLIQGEKGPTSALFVRSIIKGGPADVEGRLQVGDRLLQVNSLSVIGMPHNKAVAMIKKAQQNVQIVVSRALEQHEMSSSPNETSNKEYVKSEDVDNTVNSDSEREKEALQALLDSVKQDNDECYDTDSDLESVTATNIHHTHTSNVDIQNGNDTNAVTDSKLIIAKNVEVDQKNYRVPSTPPPSESDSEVEEEDEEEEEGEEESESEEEATESTSTVREVSRVIMTGLPQHLTDDWLHTLPLVKRPLDSLHYSGRQLQATLKQLRLSIDRDDPINEYKTLRHAKLTDMCTEARKPENKPKNRYRNVLPYDATRVRLHTEQYVNASHVRYATGRNSLHYIACQGPLPNTTGDFWQMIWEQDVHVITMVTQDTEGGKTKCDRYWPDEVGKRVTVQNRFEIMLRQSHHLADFDINHIEVKERELGEVRLVTHLNYSSWPDHGAPENGSPLLRFIHIMHMVHTSGPIVVHCSAGIGRTGALLTIDIALNMISRDIKFDIQKIVMDLRRQRQGMIQTKDQYTFCYKTCLEALESLS